MTRHLKPPPKGNYSVICPNCLAKRKIMLKSGVNNVQCSICEKKFITFLATVRAKKGKKSGKSREYVIQTVTNSGENEIKFRDKKDDDLGLKSSDIMILSFKSKGNAFDTTPNIMQNVTTNLHTKIVKSGCFVATATCGYDSWEVKVLSSFRDNILSLSKMGKLFISVYYKISPYAVTVVINRSETKKNIRKFFISPIALVISFFFRKTIYSNN